LSDLSLGAGKIIKVVRVAVILGQTTVVHQLVLAKLWDDKGTLLIELVGYHAGGDLVSHGHRHQHNNGNGAHQVADFKQDSFLIIAAQEGQDRYEQQKVPNDVVSLMKSEWHVVLDDARGTLVIEVDLLPSQDDQHDGKESKGGAVDLDEGVDPLHPSHQLLHQLLAYVEDEGD